MTRCGCGSVVGAATVNVGAAGRTSSIGGSGCSLAPAATLEVDEPLAPGLERRRGRPVERRAEPVDVGAARLERLVDGLVASIESGAGDVLDRLDHGRDGTGVPGSEVD